MMKVLTINTNPAYYDGITNVMINLYNAIDLNNMQVDFLVIEQPPEEIKKILSQNGSKVYCISRKKNNLINYIASLFKLVKKNKYDIVHIHGNSHTVILELLPSALAGCKIRFVHAHNTFCNNMKIHILATPIFDLLCTNRLACGNEAGNFMHGKHDFTVINNGIDTSRFSFSDQNRQEIRLSYEIGDKIVVGHVGTLNNSHKNQSFLIDIMKKLVNINENYHLFLLGDGEDRSNLKQKVSQLGLESSITFAGAVDDVAPFLSAFDLIVMPSFYEGLPLSLIEEQANGLRCIVSDVITEEVNVTGNVTFLSLEKGADYWAENIIASVFPLNREQDSNNAVLKIKKSGYGVKKQSRLLKEQYEEAFKKGTRNYD